MVQRDINAVFLKIAAIRLLQSDCIARILNDDLADEKNKVYSEQNA